MTRRTAGRVARGLGAATLLGALVAAAPPQDRWEQQVRRLLERAASTTAESGFVSTHDPYIRSLRAGESHAWTVMLDAGTEYRIVGVCDTDCSDVDLRLFNPAGTMVAEDVETDDVPVLSIVPPATREYTLRAIMVECDADPCRFGAGIYGR